MSDKSSYEIDTLLHAESTTISAQIQSAYESLSATEKRIADFVLNSPEQIMYNSVTQVAEELEIAQSTVTRFCRTIGLRGFQELKIRLAQDTERTTPPTNENGEDLSLHKLMAQTAANSIVDTAAQIDCEALEKAVGRIASARRIVIFGLGESGPMAQLLKIKLMGLGLAVDAQVDIHLQSIAAAHLDGNDVVIGISQQGSTKDVVGSIREARAYGATAISITGQKKSPITEVSDITLICAQRGITNIVQSFRSKASIMYVMELLAVMLTQRLNKQTAESKKKLWKTTESILEKLY